jgi:hypothetical protein
MPQNTRTALRASRKIVNTGVAIYCATNQRPTQPLPFLHPLRTLQMGASDICHLQLRPVHSPKHIDSSFTLESNNKVQWLQFARCDRLFEIMIVWPMLTNRPDIHSCVGTEPFPLLTLDPEPTIRSRLERVIELNAVAKSFSIDMYV